MVLYNTENKRRPKKGKLLSKIEGVKKHLASHPTDTVRQKLLATLERKSTYAREHND